MSAPNNGWRDAINQLACEGGDALANTLDDAKRRERILAEVGALELGDIRARPPASVAGQVGLYAQYAVNQWHKPAVARSHLIRSAAYALAAIEAIDKENGR